MRRRRTLEREWAAATAAALCLLSCGRGKNPQTDDTLPPQVSLYGVTLHAWQGNELVAMGNAAQLTYDRTTGALDASGVGLRFPNRGFTSDLELSVPSLLADLPSRRAHGKGGVTLRSSAGLLAQTPTANFDGQGLVARGSEPVQVTGPGYALDARGFAFYLITEELIFDGPVQSRLGAVAVPQ